MSGEKHGLWFYIKCDTCGSKLAVKLRNAPVVFTKNASINVVPCKKCVNNEAKQFALEAVEEKFSQVIFTIPRIKEGDIP